MNLHNVAFKALSSAGAALAMLGTVVPIARLRPAHPPLPGTPQWDEYRVSFWSAFTRRGPEWPDYWPVEGSQYVVVAVLIGVALMWLSWVINRPLTRALVTAGGIGIVALVLQVSAGLHLFNRADTSFAVHDGPAEALLLLGGLALASAPLAAPLTSGMRRLLLAARGSGR